MPYEEITHKHLSRLAEKIKQRIPVNTGDAANSLEVNGNKLLGNSYIYYLDQGRGPGKFPPPQKIFDWTKNKLGNEARQVAFLVGRKNILRRGKFTWPPPQKIFDWTKNKLGNEARQAAFLIGRKIADEGTEIFKDKSKGIRLQELVDETLDELTKELPNEVAAEALTFLDNNI